MVNRSILISGAGIAGPALATWLSASGWDVTVVERFERRRDEGQNVDIRGVGRHVLRLMGLEDAVRAAHTGETGTDFVDERGGTVASFPAGTDDTGGSTAELEILRGQLADILYDQSAGSAEYVFGDSISSMDDDGTGVDVGFHGGNTRRFDAVVVADGMRSRTRALVMPDATVRELGMFVAYLPIPRTSADNDRWRVLACGKGRVVALRPDNVGTIRAWLSIVTDIRGLERLDRSQVVPILRATFADVGWECPRVLAALDDAPLYTEGIGQVHLPSWSEGRIALLGDAAWCASPISGMGTTLALAGAYVLAGELARNSDPRTAFTEYERVLRPLVTRAQRLFPGAPGIAHPRGAGQRAALWTALRTVSHPLVKRLGGLAATLPIPRAEAPSLPDYNLPVARPR